MDKFYIVLFEMYNFVLICFGDLNYNFLFKMFFFIRLWIYIVIFIIIVVFYN